MAYKDQEERMALRVQKAIQDQMEKLDPWA